MLREARLRGRSGAEGGAAPPQPRARSALRWRRGPHVVRAEAGAGRVLATWRRRRAARAGGATELRRTRWRLVDADTGPLPSTGGRVRPLAGRGPAPLRPVRRGRQGEGPVADGARFPGAGGFLSPDSGAVLAVLPRACPKTASSESAFAVSVTSCRHEMTKLEKGLGCNGV